LPRAPDISPDGAAFASNEPRSVKAPVVWLLGQVQSGKSSIVRALTGCTDVEIGAGFKPTTRTTRLFDFPSEAPLIRFLDTRGLGEVMYDPAADIAMSEQQSHLLLVVMKALDQQQSATMDVVGTICSRRPDWPILVAQTTLHEAYDRGAAHPLPYPYDEPDPARWQKAGVPVDLARSIIRQRSLFDAVPGRHRIVFVPIDFTKSEDGHQPRDYGLPALISAVREVAPASVAASIRDTVRSANNATAARSHSKIVGFATAAAAADVVPVAGTIAVPGIQAAMLSGLAVAYGVSWDRRTVAQFAGCLGTGTMVRMLSTFGIRELVKLLPVYGQTAGTAAAAANSFATTFAVGKAATYFLGQRRLGEADAKAVAQVYGDAVKQAFELAPSRSPEGSKTDQKV
jgi:uncharacterized protein (DUF697 family)/predicted GTPase